MANNYDEGNNLSGRVVGNALNALKKKDVIAFLESVENEGLVIVNPMTGHALARHFNISSMGGRQIVDSYLRGELK